jgi:drug/metabolite transporter (DMT)-like permease
VLLALALRPSAPSARGVILAVISGAITSGVGYAIWYAALPSLRAVQAGLVQLAVPVLTAIGGVLLLGERPTLRLAAATALVLGGIALALTRGGRIRPR